MDGWSLGRTSILFTVLAAESGWLIQQKNVTNVRVKEVFRKELSKATSVYFRIDANFRPGTDLATLYYSIDGNNWTPLLKDYKMIFDYRRFFMGTKFAIFNYATKKKGGWVDVDWFHYEKKVEDWKLKIEGVALLLRLFFFPNICSVGKKL